MAAEHSSLSTWGRVAIRPSGGLIWTPPLKLPITEPYKCFLGSNPNNDTGALLALFHLIPYTHSGAWFYHHLHFTGVETETESETLPRLYSSRWQRPARSLGGMNPGQVPGVQWGLSKGFLVFPSISIFPALSSQPGVGSLGRLWEISSCP